MDHEPSLDAARAVSRGAAADAAGAATALRWRAFEELSPAELHDALALRAAVFVVEQACAFLDPDPLDHAADHLLGYAAPEPASNASLIGCLRLLPPGTRYAEASIGRVAVAKAHRGTGLGRRLMREALARAASRHPGCAVRISAQAYLARFYGALGFATASDTYLEDGIPHLEMLRAAL